MNSECRWTHTLFEIEILINCAFIHFCFFFIEKTKYYPHIYIYLLLFWYILLAILRQPSEDQGGPRAYDDIIY